VDFVRRSCNLPDGYCQIQYVIYSLVRINMQQLAQVAASAEVYVFSEEYARTTEAKIIPKNAAPIIDSGILKKDSECNTFVVGKPAKYAAKKIPTKTVPTPWSVNKNLSVLLLSSFNLVTLRL